MTNILIPRDNHCGRYCPALSKMETQEMQSICDEQQRVFIMLADQQQQEVLDKAYKDVDAMTESGEIKLGHLGVAGMSYAIQLAYKYACELLNIEPKAWSIK